MDFFRILPPILYYPAYLYSVMALIVLTYLCHAHSKGAALLKKAETFPLPTLCYALLLTLFMGLRPFSNAFGDTGMYVHWYDNIISSYDKAEWGTEWLWTDIAFLCKSLKLSASTYLLVIECIYIGTAYLCCHILMKRNVWIAFLFVVSSFSFFSYGVNGLRNGAALHILLFVIALITETKTPKIICAALCLAAIFIHKSSTLPVASLFCAIYWIKNPKQAINLWIASIFISLIAGNAIGNIFASLGFDDRMNGYFNSQNSEAAMSEFSQTGFRFDFLLYSAMPVIMTWYVTVKRQINDRKFNIIAITYIISNSFWIMVIRAAFSNRFAYLSWFLYPVVIAYPLLRLRIWDDQDKKTMQILLLYAGFTFFMYIKG